MPHPTKKQRIECHERNEEVAVADDEFLASFDDLSDVLPNILGFLSLKDVMSKRRINKKTTEAVKKTTVPLTDFCVYSIENYNAMIVMTEAMPNLQQITLCGIGGGNKWSDGEDPDEREAAAIPTRTPLDIEIISNFSKLRILEIEAILNGRYPFLFNFPLLQKLRLNYCYYLKWDLEMLAGFPLLKELDCERNDRVAGNINSLRVLKDTLEAVRIGNCPDVKGNFMDLADFPHLKLLHLYGNAVTGDITDISANDFSKLEYLVLPKGVYGGRGYELQSISDGVDLIRTLYLFNKQRPNLIDSLLPTISGNSTLYWKLMEGSPDWYESVDDYETPPFCIKFVKAGCRLGYRWESYYGDNPCEVNWLDPEPEIESSDYEKYIEELEQINRRVHMFRGFHQPPTEEEYIRLSEEYV